MTYRGMVRNGVVEFDEGPVPPDGVIVRVDPIPAGEPASNRNLSDTLLQFAGIVDDLPSDLARNHDHYLHGHPKQ
ncbi:MAG: hypothetical protein IT450_20290 [Phycisphaerales bacterium]|nr:hypothetical protein [Phycisphaerales bacterium]